MSYAGDIAPWLEVPPPQPRWLGWRLHRFDSIYGAEADGTQHWRGSEWRVELSSRARVRSFAKRRIIAYGAGRGPLLHREISYYGVRFHWKLRWDAKPKHAHEKVKSLIATEE